MTEKICVVFDFAVMTAAHNWTETPPSALHRHLSHEHIVTLQANYVNCNERDANVILDVFLTDDYLILHLTYVVSAVC